MLFIAFHTTVIAVMRYAFIVHDDKIGRFGKQRAMKLFHWILGIVPIVMTTWVYLGAANRDFDGSNVINKCNGSYDKIFLLKWGFAESQSIWSARCGMKNNNEGPASSIELIRYIQCKASAYLFLLLLSNIFDGFVYYRTWTHIAKE